MYCYLGEGWGKVKGDFHDKGGRKVGQKGILHDEGVRRGLDPPKKDNIICEQPLIRVR